MNTTEIRWREAPVVKRMGATLGQVTGVYEYRDRDGCVMFAKLRFDHPENGKTIRPFHVSDDGEVVLGEPKFGPNGKPLYRLPDLVAAPPSEPVWFVEGEKCADALREFGVVATTAGSSSSARDADLEPLRDRHVVLWPDNDAPGRRHMREIAIRLRTIAADVEEIDIDALGLDAGEDVVDWLSRNDLSGDAAAEALAGLPRTPDAPDGPDQVELTDAPGPKDDGAELWQELPYKGGTLQSRADGLRFVVESTDGDAQAPTKLSGPIRVVAELFEFESHEKWARLVYWEDRAGRPHTAVFRDVDRLGREPTWLARLVDGGLEIALASDARRQLEAFVFGRHQLERMSLAESPGWVDGVYVLPDANAVGASGRRVYLAADTGRRFAGRGSLDEWRRTVARDAEGHLLLVVALCVALAPPLLAQVGAEQGGFHLVGRSSTGKSTALRLAASVWGDPAARLESWRATTNGLEAVAAMANDGLLCLDELGQLDAADLAGVLYLLANGRGKARATISGRAASTQTWRAIVLSSGEVGIAEHAAEGGARLKRGQTIRMVDIRVPLDSRDAGVLAHGTSEPERIARQLGAAADASYGTAGLAWIMWLNEQAASGQLEAMIRTLLERFVDGLKLAHPRLNSSEQRVARRFALVAAAGELATTAGITGWIPGTAFDCVRRCFDGWLQGEKSEEQKRREELVERIRDAASTALSMQRHDPGSAPSGAPSYRAQYEGYVELLMRPAAFEREIAPEPHREETIRALERFGLLVRDNCGTVTQRRRVGGKQDRYYVLRVLDDE